jgi:EAL domain-containing protein (putative c-di-GMP-specific phosphodiesterase class I)
LPVGEWVIRRACEQARARQLAGMKPLKVAVNVSINQFKERNFFDIVNNILCETGLEPEYLELEITESILINNVNEAFKILCQLNELGVQLAIDDFGTGYSSMNYLSRLPFDLLKIDRSFIAASTNSKEDATIVNTVIALAHSLDMQVIAEGVETAEQLRLLHQAGCNLIQGYLCGKPQPLVEIDAALRNEGAVPFYRCLEHLK